MLLLLLIGFVAGIVTSLSPCVLPVLPVVLSAGAVRSGPGPGDESSTATNASVRRPLAIATGLVASFGFFTLFAGSILSSLGLPQDFLRDAALVLLGIAALGMIEPRVGDLIGRPFAHLARGPRIGTRSGFVLGLGLGLVFVPCAGPILSAVAVASSAHRIGAGTVWLTLAYCAGTAIPLFGFALLGERASIRLRLLRRHAPVVRKIAGSILLLSVIAIAANLTTSLQTSVPGYTSAFQRNVEGASVIAGQLHSAAGASGTPRSNASAAGLSDYGPAPQFAGITAWLNTPGSAPLTMASLRGKVVLIDFWTYSCINCRRSLPHVEAWYNTYRDNGLVVVGVHTPEFSFEHVVSNVRAAASQLGVDYPVAIDDSAATWNAYENEYWPAEYLIDPSGQIRHYDFGEGDYSKTESLIRELLVANGAHNLPARTDVANTTPAGPLTQESYLGYSRLDNLANANVQTGAVAQYTFPASLAQGDLALSGGWNVSSEFATSSEGASLRLAFTAKDVYLVLAGNGTVSVSVDGHQMKVVAVSGVPNLYTIVSADRTEQTTLELTFSAGIRAYDFTFG